MSRRADFSLSSGFPWSHLLRHALIVTLAHLLTSCSVWKASPPKPEAVAELSRQLRVLAPKAKPAETDRLAREAHERAYALSREYGIVTPPLIHNCLINTQKVILPSQKPMRGLCYQWAEDMAAHLGKVPHSSFDFWWGIHAKDQKFHAHNCIILTAKGAPFESGIVLDAWRSGGDLFFGLVRQEKKYHWENVPEWTSSIRACLPPF